MGYFFLSVCLFTFLIPIFYPCFVLPPHPPVRLWNTPVPPTPLVLVPLLPRQSRSRKVFHRVLARRVPVRLRWWWCRSPPNLPLLPPPAAALPPGGGTCPIVQDFDVGTPGFADTVGRKSLSISATTIDASAGVPRNDFHHTATLASGLRKGLGWVSQCAA